MKSYPTIGFQIDRSLQTIVFDKLDGSNIRAEWSRKAGFYKFGTRDRLLDKREQPLGQAVDLILAQGIERVFVDQRWDRVISFFELHGPNSFAGSHVEDEPLKATLIDVNPYKQGILDPRDFVKLFEKYDIPNVVHRGTVNPKFIHDVHNGHLQGMTFEGVVCKGMKKKIHHMFKIKSKFWLERLKYRCNGDEALFEKLK